MPSTVETREEIEAGVSDADVQRRIELRIKAGAISCHVEDDPPKRWLVTTWNVIGENS